MSTLAHQLPIFRLLETCATMCTWLMFQDAMDAVCSAAAHLHCCARWIAGNADLLNIPLDSARPYCAGHDCGRERRAAVGARLQLPRVPGARGPAGKRRPASCLSSGSRSIACGSPACSITASLAAAEFHAVAGRLCGTAPLQ